MDDEDCESARSVCKCMCHVVRLWFNLQVIYRVHKLSFSLFRNLNLDFGGCTSDTTLDGFLENLFGGGCADAGDAECTDAKEVVEGADSTSGFYFDSICGAGFWLSTAGGG